MKILEICEYRSPEWRSQHGTRACNSALIVSSHRVRLAIGPSLPFTAVKRVTAVGGEVDSPASGRRQAHDP